LLNLDTEEDTELTIGCAGGIDVTAKGSYIDRPTKKNVKSYRLTVSGLTGGHSGMDIHLGRGNANKIMNRLLLEIIEKTGAQIYSIDGGGLRNAIPRESVAEMAVSEDVVEIFEALVKAEADCIIKEYRTTDAALDISLSTTAHQPVAIDSEKALALIRAVYTCPNGIYRMSPDIEHLVQSSNNIARVIVRDGEYTVMCLTRSSVDTEKIDLANAIMCAFELVGANVEFSGSYPGWTPEPNSSIVKLMRELYETMYHSKPNVNACHAGLECGIIGRNYPKMEMISFGPNIRGAHSPDEKVQISSVQKFWDYLLATLKNIPLMQ
ncbi:MAG TPA: M20/M25/M40 family metallo-hydrolase, partial [Saprospiraceae bacterium]|nr:M20/M25/M40 family metallo-hydrolase [Saprospiraceae bacterium]